MIDVVNLKVDDTISIDYLLITFELSEAYLDIGNYQFDLQRTLSTNFTTIAKDLKRFSYIDKQVNLLNDDVKYYYRVKVTNKETGEIRYSKVAYSGESESDRWSSAIYEIEQKYIKDVISNDRAYVFKRIRFGEHCPNCYNPNRGCADDDDCPVCYGTGVRGGYYPPEKIYLNFYNTQQLAEDFTPSEISTKGSDISAWTLNYPLVDVSDIIVYGAQRFIVTSVVRSIKGGWTIRQVINLSELPKTNTAFRLEVNHGLLES